MASSSSHSSPNLRIRPVLLTILFPLLTSILHTTSHAVLVGAQGNNQECFFAPGRRAGSAYIPCMDPDKFGVVPCCANGDVCLTDSACWDPLTEITYQIGCTSEDYDHDNCPDKCGLDVDKSRWVGLIHCPERGDLWVCHHPETCGTCPDQTEWDPVPMELPEEEPGCSGLATVKAAFGGPISLKPLVWLPSAGTSTVYFSPSGDSDISVHGYTPTWVTRDDIAAPTTKAGTTVPSSETIPTETDATSEAEPIEEDGGNGLSTGAKIGIGVGLGVAGLIFMAMGALLYRWKTKKKAREAAAAGTTGDDEKNTGAAEVGGIPPGGTPVRGGGGYYAPVSPEIKDRGMVSPQTGADLSHHRLSELPTPVPTPSAMSVSPNPASVMMATGTTPSPGLGVVGHQQSNQNLGAVQGEFGAYPSPLQTGPPAHRGSVMSELPAEETRQVHELG